MAYDYGAKEPEKLKIKDMSDRQKELLLDSQTFCILPWMHLHAYPDGRAYPCCFAFDKYPVGDFNKQSMKEVFNGEKMRELRRNMLENKKSKTCAKCYDQEDSGFFSLRLSSNKHHGHNIDLVDATKDDGTADFVMKYWDIRFSNICNFACRSCGTWFSSNWYEDHIKINGAPPNHAKIIKVGRTPDDMWNQVLENIGHAEQFYFAGGEPLIMEEHYRVLKELDRRKMYHVRLIYNTNFSRTTFKDMDVFEIWKKFDSVSIGASLDAEGKRAEFMRTGTKWSQTLENRKRMMKVCPEVDFYLSSTVGLTNALHVCDFHKSWVEQGLIQPQDFNLNLLQMPTWQRMDILPIEFKEQVKKKYETHLDWLKNVDPLTRASKGYESALDWMFKKDMSNHLTWFFERTRKYDQVRNENFVDVFPEWKELFDKYEKN